MPHGAAGSAEQQVVTIERAMGEVAALVSEGSDVVVTHGNGPQVGNLLTKNLLARHVVPAMPLHWCVAQTQATIGLAMLTALEARLRAAGIGRPIVPVLSRVLVRRDDPAWRGTVELRELAAKRTFGVGSMAPKVEAALRFVEATGHPATIGPLERAADVLHGRSGTRVTQSGDTVGAAR